MIRKEGKGYRVYSESGKPLSKILKSHDAAVKRLRQVEHFKRQDKK